MNAEQTLDTLKLTVSGLIDSLTHDMPDCAYRDFCLWALSPKNPAQEAWLHAMGIPQFVQLTLGLLEGAVDARAMDQMLLHSVPMNVYLIFEVVSDDFAIGLARQAADDTTFSLRRQILYAFNQAMIQRLRGSREPAAQLLAPIRAATNSVSGFDQSLSPYKHQGIAQLYHEAHKHLSIAELEYAVWPRLVANIETCVAVARRVAGYQVGPLVSQGLVNRYAGVNSLLDEPAIALPRRVHIGVDTILVEPTLAYYLGVLAETVQPVDNFGGVVADGTLAESLYIAALLVRVLNDLGPRLVAQTHDERSAFIHSLAARCSPEETQTLAELLIDSNDEFGMFLTRIQKDLLHREFNICLHGIEDLPASRALPIFEYRLGYVSKVYAQGNARLSELSEVMSEQLATPIVSNLITHFVQFHHKLYAHQYNTSVGEYAV